jgi:hypothetical protein
MFGTVGVLASEIIARSRSVSARFSLFGEVRRCSGAGTIVPPAPFPLPHLDIAETTDLLLIANICHVDPLSQATRSELDEIYLRRTHERSLSKQTRRIKE